MRKLFRFHHGSLADSLATTVEVIGYVDMCNIILREMPYVHNIRISKASDRDTRLPDEWGGYSRYVLADMEGCCGCCIGMCNFYEE